MVVFNWHGFGSYQYTPAGEDFQGFLWTYCVEKAFIGNFCIKKGESAGLAQNLFSIIFVSSDAEIERYGP